MPPLPPPNTCPRPLPPSGRGPAIHARPVLQAVHVDGQGRRHLRPVSGWRTRLHFARRARRCGPARAPLARAPRGGSVNDALPAQRRAAAAAPPALQPAPAPPPACATLRCYGQRGGGAPAPAVEHVVQYVDRPVVKYVDRVQYVDRPVYVDRVVEKEARPTRAGMGLGGWGAVPGQARASGGRQR